MAKLRSDSEEEFAARKAKVRASAKTARKQADRDNIIRTAKDVGKEVATDVAIGAATGGVGLIGRAALKGGAKLAKAGYKAGRARSIAKAGEKARKGKLKDLTQQMNKNPARASERLQMAQGEAVKAGSKAAQAKTKKIYAREQAMKKRVNKVKAKVRTAAEPIRRNVGKAVKEAKKRGEFVVMGSKNQKRQDTMTKAGQKLAAEESAQRVMSRAKKDTPKFSSRPKTQRSRADLIKDFDKATPHWRSVTKARAKARARETGETVEEATQAMEKKFGKRK